MAQGLTLVGLRLMGGLDDLPPGKAFAHHSRMWQRPIVILVFAFGSIALLLTTSYELFFEGFGGNDSSEAPPSAPEFLAESATHSPLNVISLSMTAGGQPLSLRLKLLPEYSQSSADFLRHAAASHCDGELYRSELNFVVQGRISCTPEKLPPKVVKGDCPAGVTTDPNRKCFAHDPDCGCHGPIMYKGMVGWAGGSAGPDFFIYTADMRNCEVGACPAQHWANDHTVFAEVADSETWHAIEVLYTLPVEPRGGMTFFSDKISLSVDQP
uniref:PPIase cyclophilin-type domain-containing protein n=1 Tax=Noctiluca scintillans TaxID=2966 RepID=A0A7S1FHA2_NOCSC